MARIFAAMLSLSLAAAILVIAVPRMVAALLAMPTEYLVDQLRDGGNLDQQQLEQMLAGRERALIWETSEARYADLSLATLMVAEALFNLQQDEASFAHVEASVVHAKTGLAQAPARPFSWTRLAYAEYLRDEASPIAPAALEMAIITAPYEPLLTFVRLDIALVSWETLSLDQRRLAGEQIAIAWRQSDETLVDLALASEREQLVRGYLPDTADDLARYDRLMATARATQEQTPMEPSPATDDTAS